MKFLYTVLLYLIQPIIWLRLLFLSKKIPAYRKRWSERYGFCKRKVKPKGILLHSVSLGETLSAVPLVHALKHHYPSLPITITTITPIASEQVLLIFGKEVCHVYFPYELPCAVKRFLDALLPKLVILMETELWPNMISEIYSRKIPLIIANARLSKRSVNGYRKLGKFMQKQLLKITMIAAQNDEDGARFISLGLKHNQLAIIGNLKFDIDIMPSVLFQANIIRKKWSTTRKIWIAASTHHGEETTVLKAHNELLKIFPDLLLILVPRHPERFKKVSKIVRKIGFNFIFRSTGEIPSNSTQVVIGDTVGELILLYGIADLAFVGGSLVAQGGHNPLEPAAHGIPVLMGPYTFNFKDICTKLKDGNALITVNSVGSLVKEISNLFIDENRRLNYGENAIKVLYKNQGALSRFLKLLQLYLPQQRH